MRGARDNLPAGHGENVMRAIEMPRADVQERIRRRAYSLWEEEGRPEGCADAHWLRAEAEMIGADPGAEGVPGTPGAGVNICPACEGTGRRSRGRCRQCGGTGRIIDAPEPRGTHHDRSRSRPRFGK
jgi:hypothetical protein